MLHFATTYYFPSNKAKRGGGNPRIILVLEQSTPPAGLLVAFVCSQTSQKNT